ncbi:MULTISPECIES: hypothetical protein [Tenebrionibacter/Tenebrionicola group]|jgi:hypothetical protein|uniref:Uncharacterized protein n=2 Tax=Tenebrionibacter/Tenebrionicola group TaxID=2969848 RepID=A0A8K0V796_9ENTR|nr:MULTISPECIES: hypothetical protein [Tenebrionibacter/Tenebrionicola group]MBK4716390.1 hypothetical protein [Tenebrionibacter intestinalis]MBV5096525.1 hypothetical protein [Tenebrionicola larvae]
MNETTYQIDIAAEMLGCQQKKILSEWAKGTIQIVLNFGDKTESERAKLLIDSSTQPNSKDFFSRFPGQRPHFSFDSTPLSPEVQRRNREIETEVRRELLRQQGQSGFNISHNQRERAEMLEGGVIETEAYIFGLWCVAYDDYSRQQVQSSFSMTPYPVSVTPDGVTAIYTPSSYEKDYTLAKKNLRITESGMAVMRKLLANRPGRQQVRPVLEELTEQPKSHGGIERFALEREKILAAALYVARHFPKEVGKSFKSHAEAIAKHGYIFWQNEPAPDAGRIAKMLSDAARPPSEWKILGGNAKSK